MNNASNITLKNGIPYNVSLGYNVYGADYSIRSNNLMEKGNDAKKPEYSAQGSSVFEFTWWDIESASVLSAGVVAVISTTVWSMII